MASIAEHGLRPSRGKLFLGVAETVQRFGTTSTDTLLRVIVPPGTVIHDNSFESDELYVTVVLRQYASVDIKIKNA
jgi:hypothetical protein